MTGDWYIFDCGPKWLEILLIVPTVNSKSNYCFNFKYIFAISWGRSAIQRCFLWFFSLQLTEYEDTLPITERSNPITQDIDLSDSVQIVQLLKKCDEEIFQKEEDSATNYKVQNDSMLTTSVNCVSLSPNAAWLTEFFQQNCFCHSHSCMFFMN